jgi:aspartate/methionine/tyrosine aminotransferase
MANFTRGRIEEEWDKVRDKPLFNDMISVDYCDFFSYQEKKVYDKIKTKEFEVDEISEDIVEVFNSIENVSDYKGIVNLYIGLAESKLQKKHICRENYIDLWKNRKKYRCFTKNDILDINSRVTVSFIKELFNFFFNKDLFEGVKLENKVIMSGGVSSEISYPLPDSLKECIRYTLCKDWYGYSNSIGRFSSREAVALLETNLINDKIYGFDEVVLTLGGTVALANVIDFLVLNHYLNEGDEVICGIPNYPPMLKAISNRCKNIKLVKVGLFAKEGKLDEIIKKNCKDTKIVFIQTVINPTGTVISEQDIEKLIRIVPSSTLIVLDECHDILMQDYNNYIRKASKLRGNSNIIRIKSISKDFSAPGLKIGWFLADKSIVSEYYEYSSTVYGSPPSFFYLLTEILAKFETWRINNKMFLSTTELNMFEDSYHLDLRLLNNAYAEYYYDRNNRNINLINRIKETMYDFFKNDIDVVNAEASVNVSVIPNKSNNSYTTFKKTMSETNIVVFPGILSFLFCNRDLVRISPAIYERYRKDSINKLCEYWR